MGGGAYLALETSGMTNNPARAAENEVVGNHNLIDGVDHLRGTFMRK